MHTQNWQLFTHPNFKLKLYYPTDAQLRITENPELGSTRVHLTTSNSPALYLEMALVHE